MSAIPQEIQDLSTAEKLDLVELLWDDIAHASAQSDIPVDEETRAEVLRRAAWREANPGPGKSLEEIVQTLGVRL